MERLIALWCPGLSKDGARGDEARAFAELLAVVTERCPFVAPVRLGLAVLPARAPSRFFGGEDAVLDLVREDLGSLVRATDSDLHLGIADGLFAAAMAARRDVIVPPGAAAAFLAPLSVATLRRPEIAAVCQRLGLGTLGRFASVEPDRIIERFGTDGLHCHQVARAQEGELLGLRDPGIDARLRALDEPPVVVAQPTFFGGTSLNDERAARAALRLQRVFEPSVVLMAVLDEGNDPQERASMVPFATTPAQRRDEIARAPWPAQIPAPSPTTVLSTPTPVALTDPTGDPVTVSGRGLLVGVPGHCTRSETAEPDVVVAWAGPWPLATRWWDRRRWRVRLQVVTASGIGLLLAYERQRWWLLGCYD